MKVWKYGSMKVWKCGSALRGEALAEAGGTSKL